MELTINRSQFLGGLYLAQGIADRKVAANTPAAANVLLRTDGTESILCAATDLRTSMVAELPASVASEGGVAIAAKQLFDIVKSLPDEQVHLKRQDNNYLQLKSGKARYRVVGTTDRDFPRLPDHRELALKEVDAATLADMLGKTVVSVSTDETRQHLSGIFFESDGATACMVSTDGHRLSKVVRSLGDAPVLDHGVIIPRKGVLEIRRLLEGSGGTCDIAFSDGHLFVRRNDVVLSIKLVDAQFPPYQQVIPSENDKSVTMPRAAFLACLKRISLMSSDRSFGVRFSLSSGRLRVASDNPDLGEAQEDIDVEYSGSELVVGFNARYFVDAVNEMTSDNVVLQLSGELDPGLVKSADDDGYLAVVMPMRI